jgi:hypothetical protein
MARVRSNSRVIRRGEITPRWLVIGFDAMGGPW